jgi:hypothetical protein
MAMAIFEIEIRMFERESNALHEKLHRAFDCRHQSEQEYQDWKSAAERFRNHIRLANPIFGLCYRALERVPDSVEREFVFDYIQIDPYFFRSGYLMERIVRKVKKLELTQAEKSSIRELLLKRIRSKALRNFRDICRLVPQIEDQNFEDAITVLSRSSDQAVRHRAEFALSYFNRLR